MSLYLHILLPVSFLGFLLHQLILRPYFFSPIRNVRGPSNGWDIFVGAIIKVVRGEPGMAFLDWAKDHGSTVRVIGPVGIERMVFMRTETLHEILVTRAADYPRPKYLENILGLIAGHGLLTVSGAEHKQMRKTMNQAFALPHLMAQTDMYYESIHGFIDILNNEIASEKSPEQGKVIIMHDWLSKVTLDIIANTAFGYKPDSIHNPHNELAAAYEELVSMQSGPNLARLLVLMVLPFRLGPRFFTSQWVRKHEALLNKRWFLGGFFSDAGRLNRVMHTIRRLSRQLLDEKMREISAAYEGVGVDDMDLAGKKDVMSLLLKARAEYERQQGAGKGLVGGYGMSDDAMVDQVLTFLAAGHETTASGLAWTLYLLAQHPEFQAKLREEVLPIFGPPGSRPDYRTIKDMKWLDAIIMESLRVFPPVPVTTRKAGKDDYIDGLMIPKGTIIVIPIRAVNMYKDIWGDDAESFNPPRWFNLPETYVPTLSLLSFIAGPHACIGKTMAIMEMKAVVGSLIANFSFELAYEGQVAKAGAAITMKPTDSMPLRVRKLTT